MVGRPSPRHWMSAAALAVVVSGCDLNEVVVPGGEPIVVVHGIVRPDLPEQFFGRQFIVVERSFTGAVNPVYDPETGETRFHDDDSLTIPYGGFPSTPLEGATVWVANLDFPDDPCGNTVPFQNDPGMPMLFTRPGVYWSPPSCPTLRPGDRLALRVETPEGQVVTGVTRIPGMEAAFLTVAGETVTFGTDHVTTFNRDRDTLRVRVQAYAGRLLQFEVRRNGDLTDFGTKIYADTTAFALPANVVNTFVLGDEDDVFRAGRSYVVTLALTDSNYFDFARSENNRFTGRGFINRLEGGIGVFGSLVASSTMMRAVGDVDDPREGVYRMQGVFTDAVNVDLTWELYLARPTDSTEFSAFVEGRWLYRDIQTSADGWFVGNEFTAVITDTVGMFVRSDTLRGVRRAGAPWEVVVLDQCGGPVGSERCVQGRPVLFRGTMAQQEGA